MNKILATLLVTLSVSCATNPDIVKPVETKLDVKGNVGDGKLGINDKNEAIIQEEKQAQDELVIQDAVNMRLKDEAGHHQGELKECLTYLADKRLGGNGKIPEIPDVDSLKTDEDSTEEFGQTDDGSLKMVKKTSFMGRLKNARSYEKSLRSITKVLEKQNEQCQMNLELARNKVGLPSKKAQAEGYFNSNGKWVQTKKGESGVSDAFEIQADRADQAED